MNGIKKHQLFACMDKNTGNILYIVCKYHNHIFRLLSNGKIEKCNKEDFNVNRNL